MNNIRYFNRLRTLCMFQAVAWAMTLSFVSAMDHWAASTTPGMVTNNDCGFVSSVAGYPVIRRSFQAEGSDGAIAHMADRIHSGDEIVVPPGGRLEWTSGNNIVIALGSDSRARLDGLRTFVDPDGNTILRLDIKVTQGACRAQVRLNNQRPESVLVSLNDTTEVLVLRGDVDMLVESAWRVASLSGSAQARIKRGGVVGAPFTVSEGMAVGSVGEESLDTSGMATIKRRLPFSFELTNAALPPLPALSRMLEAP